MSMMEKVAMVGVLIAGYLSICKYVDVLREKKPQSKEEQDFVKAWDALMRSWKVEKELEEMKADAIAIEKQQRQFEKKWGKLLR